MISKFSFPWLFGLVGLGMWFLFSTLLHAILPPEYLFNHLLTSWVNGICFYLAGSVLGFVYQRNRALNDEANWKERAHLPELVLVTDYDQIAHLQERISGTDRDKRPNALLHAAFVALSRAWSPDWALTALNTVYRIEKDRIATRYGIWYVIAGVISVSGFFGTLLGVSQSLPLIQDMDVARRTLHIAFDTSLISIVVGSFVRYCVRLLERYDADVLINVYQEIFDNLVQAIKRPKDLHPGERSPVVKPTRWPEGKTPPHKSDSNGKE